MAPLHSQPVLLLILATVPNTLLAPSMSARHFSLLLPLPLFPLLLPQIKEHNLMERDLISLWNTALSPHGIYAEVKLLALNF